MNMKNRRLVENNNVRFHGQEKTRKISKFMKRRGTVIKKL